MQSSNNHYDHVVLLAWISLTLSLAIHLYHPSFLTDPLDYILCPYRAVIDRFQLVIQHLHIRVKGPIEERHLWVLLQLCPACFVHLVRIVLKIGGRWLYSCCLVECYCQDFFSMTCSIFVQFLSSLFSISLVSIHVVYSCSRMDTTAAWKKLHFILLYRFNFNMIDDLSIAVYAFASKHINVIFSRVDAASQCGDDSFLIKAHILCFVCIDMEANATCCLLAQLVGAVEG